MPVSAFLKSGAEALEMELAAGKAGLQRTIQEAALNRPGLALSGFFAYFAHRRVQVLGMAENAYLASMKPSERGTRLREFFGKKIPCVVVTRHKRILPELVDLAEEFKVPLLHSRQITMHFINSGTIIMENLVAPRMTYQGTMVEIMGIGVMIEGKPGLGKSETALGLIKRGHSLVSDDVTAIRLDSAGAIIGAPVNVTRYHMEIRGLGIIHVPSLFGVTSVRKEKRLDLVVTLYESGSMEEPDRSGQVRLTRSILGVDVPQVMIGVKPGRDLVTLVETAALDYQLRRLGHDAAKELDEHLMSLMSGGKAASE